MTSLGFENYAEALKVYLSKYREVSLRNPFCCQCEVIMLIPKQQQNQTNRDRAMENNPWGSSMMSGERPDGATGAGSNAGDFPEGATAADAADPNYMYGSGGAHNGAAGGEGY